MKSLIVIPARMEAERLPGKPLLKIGEHPLLLHIYLAAKASDADYVMVTSSDRIIGKYCLDNSIPFFPSSKDCTSGTERCAEVYLSMDSEKSKDISVVVNHQVDEPLIQAADLNELIVFAREAKSISTLVMKMRGHSPFEPNIVKVAFHNDWCSWFSRSPFTAYANDIQHIGVYAFPTHILRKLHKLKPTDISRCQGLEQLTWIQNGHNIEGLMINPEVYPLSINSSFDLKEFRKKYDEEAR